MDVTQFKALRPEFSASTYDARITALLAVIPELDEDRAGNQLLMALSAWVAGKLARQDFTILYGVGAASGSSTSLEKQVGEVRIKTSQSHSQSSMTGGKGKTPIQLNLYEQEYEGYLLQFGRGAIAVGMPTVPVVA